MLLNYIKIQFLRFFKGRMWILTLAVSIAFNIFACFITTQMVPILENKYLGSEGFETLQEIREFAIFLPIYLDVGYLLQVAPGIFTIIYVANYYRYRTHINLEIRLRNRILFAISEEIILLVMLCMMYAVSLVTLFITMAIGGVKLDQIQEALRNPEAIYVIALIFGLGMANLNTAYLLAKFFRSKIIPIIIQSVSGILMAGVISGIGTAMSTVVSSEGVAVTRIDGMKFMIILIFIHALVTFILGVLLFQRRYEERVV